MCKHTRAREGTPQTPVSDTRSGPGICEAKPGSCVFNCILEQGGCRTPRPPLIRGRQARREAPAEPAPRGRPEDRPRQSRQDRSRSGSPGTRLGRPFGPGFALRPGLIGRKDHGRRRAQAARQSRTAVMGAPPPQQDPSASAVLAVLPMLAASGCAWVRATPGGVLPRLPRPQSAGACPCEDAGHLHRASPSLLRETIWHEPSTQRPHGRDLCPP